MELSYPKEINLDRIKEHFLKNWFKDICVFERFIVVS